jgi:hypothetical protein
MNIPIVTLVFLLALGFPLLSQEASPTQNDQPSVQTGTESKTRIAVITRKNGSILKGIIIKQEQNTITLDSDGVTMSIPADSVVNITYEDSTADSSAQPPKDQAKLKEVLQVIRKLPVATGVGISYRDYSALLIQVNTDAANILMEIDDCPAKTEMKSALAEYLIAQRVWSGILREDYLTLINMSKEEKAVFDNKYHVPIKKVTVWKVYYKSDIMASIWAVAKNHFMEAEKLINAAQ